MSGGTHASSSSGRRSAAYGADEMFTRFAAIARSFLQAREGVVAIQMRLAPDSEIGRQSRRFQHLASPGTARAKDGIDQPDCVG